MAVLTDFAHARAQVQEFLRPQRASVGHFWDKHENVFFRTEGDRERAEAEGDARKAPTEGVHRLTSTVTCLESIVEAPAWDAADGEDWTNEKAQSILTGFVRHALTTQVGWQSDDAAWVYCRVRTLGGALRLLADDIEWTSDEKANAAALLEQAWKSRANVGGSFGLRESTEDPLIEGHDIAGEENDQRYPANAFLTYWGLLAAAQAGKLQVPGQSPLGPGEQKAARDWLRETLAGQVAYHFNESHHADPQQLAWSLCGLVRFTPGTALASNVSTEHELLVAGLRAFFEQQRRGTWPSGAPLFHYRNAGNAYAYSFETLAELLSLATSREVKRTTADALSDALREYSSELLAALNYAEQTGQHLSGTVVAWSSGHHPHRTSPESWATASVYRFAQALRRLFGMWSAQSAAKSLASRRPSETITTLLQRGSTWDLGHGTAGGFMSTAFVQPVRRAVADSDQRARFLPDADEPVFGEKQARSAMLFGPPGTGKTKLVEAIAGALEWDFVEITPAQFLDRGVDHVSAQADTIFRQVMELDRCVVLLDEIDELIHKRDPSAETIERFFTTTMLPRLAKLWDARRVLFFVNTNNIGEVDSAIARSQRFDAALIVLPPGHAVKRTMLQAHGLDLLSTAEDVTNALLNPTKIAEGQRGIGWLATVRYDQMEALADHLKETLPGGQSAVGDDDLVKGLGKLVTELSRMDWDGNLVEPQSDPPMPAVKKLFEYERRDARMKMWAALDPKQDPTVVPTGLETETIDDQTWVAMGQPASPEAWAEKHDGVLAPNGVVTFAVKTTDPAL